jgi:hypothetical protein
MVLFVITNVELVMVVMDQCAGNNAQVVSEMMEPFVISRTLMAEAQDILARTNV